MDKLNAFPVPFHWKKIVEIQRRCVFPLTDRAHEFLCKTFSKLVVNAFVLIYSFEIGTFCVTKQVILVWGNKVELFSFQSEHEILIKQQQQQKKYI